MGEVKHTAGPWVVSCAQACETTVRAKDARTGQRIATTFASHANQASSETRLTRIRENEANARLIAASPDLLDCLRTVRDYVTDRLADVKAAGGASMIEMVSEDLARIDAAIAKATGSDQ